MKDKTTDRPRPRGKGKRTLFIPTAILAFAALFQLFVPKTDLPLSAADAAVDGHANHVAPGTAVPPAAGEKEVLYWYDPMYPGTRFDKPGKSPFMDMRLVPRYADEAKGEGIVIDPAQLQNLGLKTSRVASGKLSFARDFPANVEFNDHRKAVIQPRADGFVSSATPLAVGDFVEEGDLLATVTVPGWASDQSEYLLLKSQNASKNILSGVREKLRLSGMPEEMLARVDSTSRAQTELKITSPIAGVVTELSIFPGMNADRSMTLAVIQGTDPVWVTAYVPEKDLHLTSGRARVTLPAFPDRAFEILNLSVLPKADPVTRSVPVRLTIRNPGGLLKPGLLASLRLRSSGEEGLLIPTQSLIDLGEEKRVIVRKEDGSFLPQPVKTGFASGDQTLVSEGLSEGDEIVSVGLFLIDSEANLRGALARLSDGEPEASPSSDP
ncbi:MAG: efflux RND transporter periplasmic adaptor subunit [Deltaproteobacteria bacterium]|jgi:Cu(I)/Ag(I) efflux system membrane fusion protein|nr:efflux RND transporter periplasmic adaptor subunit [Deltaproteobacteria bacterium]